MKQPFLLAGVFFIHAASTLAGVGDPQLRTDHPWYPGELAMSSFERLFATQAEQYRRATGIEPRDDHHRALACWFFRNTHFAHGEEGREDLWGNGFKNDSMGITRDYWTGLFAHGFALCGSTHAQWTAEMDALLGRGRSRVVGTAGHNSFEAYLTGAAYGGGRWAMLDHDLSTVIFDAEGRSLLGLDAIAKDWKTLASRDRVPQRQHGWLVCGLHPDDGSSYAAFKTAEYLAGYAGPPPVVHLRAGESLRRYFEPGLEDGRTFVFWGRNYKTGGVPGLERSRTWVNQPEAMHGSKTGTPHVDGQARYGNAVYAWRPDFREGVASQDEAQVTLEFYTPYIVAASPALDSAWGVYEPGCKNGLVLRGRARCPVAVSTDGGTTWKDAGVLRDRLDLTDAVKGHRQWHLRFFAPVTQLREADVTITTVCQANPATFPRLKDGNTRITHEASGRAIVSFGPNKAQAEPCVVEGAFDSPRVTLEFRTPRGEPVCALYVAAHVASGNPPRPDVAYTMEYSLDDGRTWQSLLKEARLDRRGVEPADFWSQSVWSAQAAVPDDNAGRVKVRLRNSGGKRYLRAEGHLLYDVPGKTSRVTYAWSDNTGEHRQEKSLAHSETWDLATGVGARTRWVQIAAP